MKPPQFDYRDPRSIEEVLDLLGEFGDDAALLAGGQSLLRVGVHDGQAGRRAARGGGDSPPCRIEFRYEVARRHGDFPFVGLCMGVALDAGTVTEARAAAGVADRPLRLHDLEEALIGRPLAEVLETAALTASEEADPPDDQHGSSEFRRGVLRTLVRRLADDLAVVAA